MTSDEGAMTDSDRSGDGPPFRPGRHPNSLRNLRRGRGPRRGASPAPANGAVTASVRGKLLRQVAGRRVADELADVMIQKALDGDFRFFKEILDRTEGKAPDRAEGPADAAEEAAQRTIEAVMKDPHALKLARQLAERMGGREEGGDDGRSG